MRNAAFNGHGGNLIYGLPEAGASRNAIRTGSLPNREEGSDRDAQRSPRLIGNSPPLQRVRRELWKFARTDAAVLITGESGTGKELAARMVHDHSARSNGPFVAVNCGGLPSSLIAAELFGHEKGAFTGATMTKIGLIEAASGGTLFLDEIGDLPIDAQPVLLRFLQERQIARIGGRHCFDVDVRVVTATNKKLEEHLRDGLFREDLFFRIRTLSTHIPPLRDCRSDILTITQHYVEEIASDRFGETPTLTPNAEAALLDHDWPGNVRELIGRVHRALATCESTCLTDEDFGFRKRERRHSNRHKSTVPCARTVHGDKADSSPSEPVEAPAEGDPAVSLVADASLSLAEAKNHLEETVIRREIERNGKHVSLAAQKLGVSKVTLYRLMKKHKIGLASLRD